MQDKIAVNTDRLKSDSEKIRDLTGTLQADIVIIKECALQQDQMWQGEGSESFKNDLRTDLEILISMTQNLYDIYNCEVMAINRYENSEKQINKIVSDIQV